MSTEQQAKKVQSLCNIVVEMIATNIEYWCTGLTQEYLKDCMYLLTPFDHYYVPSHIRQKLIDALQRKNKLSPTTLLLFINQDMYSLSLSKCSKKINSCIIHQVIRRAPGLLNLDLSACKKLSNTEALLLASKMVCLQNVDLSGCEKLGDSVISTLVSSCPGLLGLRLKGLTKVTDVGIKDIGKASILQHLDIEGCAGVTDYSIFTILENCHALKELSMAGCWNVTSEAFRPLLDSSTPSGLIKLDLSVCSISDLTIHILRLRCPNMSSLSVEGCSELTDAAFTELPSDYPGVLERGENYYAFSYALTHIALGGCGNIGDKGVASLVAQCKQIASIRLPQNLRDKGVKKLLQNLVGLRVLNMEGCQRVTSKAFLSVENNVAGLEVLNCKNCIIGDAIVDFILHNKALKELNVSGCAGVGDDMLLKLSRGIDCIESIDVSGTKVSANAVHAFLLGDHPSLQLLAMKDCRKVARKDWTELGSLFPRINLQWT